MNVSEEYHYPYGPLWTVVAGEHDRTLEEGTEQRLMVEKIIIHERYRQYHHDIGISNRPLISVIILAY